MKENGVSYLKYTSIIIHDRACYEYFDDDRHKTMRLTMNIK